MFFWLDDWWKPTVLPLIFYLTKTKVLPLMFFFMTTNKKQQRYPLCFFSWRPIKNDSVTPYALFHDDWWKTTVLPLIFYSTRTIFFSIMSIMFLFMTTNKKQQCYPLCFFSWRPIKNNSVTPYVFFHDDQ